jgi:hypothetical protein
MKVNIYHAPNSYMIPTGAEHDICAPNVDLTECFPEPGDEEYLLAHMELERSGRYWGGGGAAPIFLITKAEEDMT